MIIELDTKEFKKKFVDKLYDFSWWCKDHKEVLAVAIPVAFGITTKTCRYCSRKSAIKAEKNLKDLYFYDRSLGAYLRLKRKLTPSQLVLIDKRHRAGESITSILSSMRVLK